MSLLVRARHVTTSQRLYGRFPRHIDKTVLKDCLQRCDVLTVALLNTRCVFRAILLLSFLAVIDFLPHKHDIGGTGHRQGRQRTSRTWSLVEVGKNLSFATGAYL